MVATIQINKRGTLTLPKAMRERLGLKDGGTVMAEESDQGIVLRAVVSFPVEMYSDSRVAEFDNEDFRLGAYLKKRSKK